MRFLFSNGALELKTKGLNEAGELIKWFDLTKKI